MDGLTTAASVTAVVDISLKVLALCVEYASAVQDAREDIERLKREMKSLRHVLRRVQDEDRCRDTLNQCLSELTKIEARLTSKKESWNRRFIPLKWPFKKKEIDGFLGALERHKATLTVETTLVIDEVRNLVSG